MAPLYSDKGRPGIESRFVIGLLLLKHMFGLSDEGVCEALGLSISCFHCKHAHLLIDAVVGRSVAVGQAAACFLTCLGAALASSLAVSVAPGLSQRIGVGAHAASPSSRPARRTRHSMPDYFCPRCNCIKLRLD